MLNVFGYKVWQRMADYEYPRELEFRDELSKIATGKFLRREFREGAQTG